jgi:hypothetical protein
MPFTLAFIAADRSTRLPFSADINSLGGLTAVVTISTNSSLDVRGLGIDSWDSNLLRFKSKLIVWQTWDSPISARFLFFREKLRLAVLRTIVRKMTVNWENYLSINSSNKNNSNNKLTFANVAKRKLAEVRTSGLVMPFLRAP